ncbi:hypothetical protein GCM10022261_28760 [Brevibacterium daeguense]|uniref:VTT domain-containing protein n=2 Tax=Brevibacterium daeguense TaxID=909936 RepID=A0ABP8EN44_9MICO
MRKIPDTDYRLAVMTSHATEQLAASSGGALTGFTGWVVSVMETLGVAGVGLLVALENIFPPIPSEIILPLAGFTASQGSMNLFGAIVFATVGSVVGALGLYYLGYAFGLERLRRWASKIPLIDVVDIDKTVSWFAKHGPAAVFFGRMIPLFRSLISIPAGVEKMRLSVFMLFTTLGSLIWNSIFVVAGYLLGENWQLVEDYAGWFQRIVIALVLIAVVWWVQRRIRRNRVERRLAAEIEAGDPHESDQRESDQHRFGRHDSEDGRRPQ